MKTAQRENRALFVEALIEALSRKYEAALSSATAASPAEAYHAKVRQTILKARSDAFRKRLLTALLAAALLLLASCTAVYYARTELDFFSAEERENHLAILFTEEQKASAPNTIEEHYTMTYIPEDFSVKDKASTLVDVEIFLENENGEMITFHQYAFGGGTAINLDTEHSAWQILNIGERDFVYHKGAYSHSIYWCDGRYLLKLSSNAPIPLEEIEKIANGITVDEG